MTERLHWSGDELIDALYGAAVELVPPSRPLELLAELTRADKAFLARFNFDQRKGAILASFNAEPNFIDVYNQLYSSQNPWLARASYFQAEGLVWRGSEIVDPAILKETEFFKLFMYGQRIQHTVHLVVQVRGPELLHVMLTRSPLVEDFEPATIEICRFFARHARRAVDIGSAAATRQFVQEGLAKAIDEMAAGVALIEAPTTILHMNSTFAKLVNGAATEPAPTRQFPWTQGRRPIDKRLPRPLADALTSLPIPRSCIIEAPDADSEGRPVTVAIRPLQLPANRGQPARSGYILLCRSSVSEIEVDETGLKTAYSLTAAEARICAALVSGENVHALSHKLGISPQTARTHLKRIFDKTATTRQPELIRLLMTFAYRKPAKIAADAARSPEIATHAVPRRPERSWPLGD